MLLFKILVMEGKLFFGMTIGVSRVLLWRGFVDFLVSPFKRRHISKIWEGGVPGGGFGN
jgi:hypothetical protein